MANRFVLRDARYVDVEDRFQMCEGLFEDSANPGTFVYANISNAEVEDFTESEVRIYSGWFEDLCNAEDYELTNFYEDDIVLREMKEQLLAWRVANA